MPRPPFTASPLRVWAVADTTAQLTWGALPAGPVTVTTSPPSPPVILDHPGGPGAVFLGGLQPGRAHVVVVTFAGGTKELRLTALESLPGAQLARVATVSDLHLGARRWGFLKTMVEPDTFDDPHPTRCARATIAGAIEWGAQLLIIKGDAAHHRHPANFEALGQLVDEFPDLPMLLIPGNHDVDFSHSRVDLPQIGARQLPYTSAVEHRDLAGIRVVVGDTTIPGRGEGTVANNGQLLIERAVEATTPVLMAVHHHFERHPVTTYWPPGISKEESIPFLDQLATAQPRTFVTSGHSHRNRSRQHKSLTLTEVASTRDWPGVWAGYTVHEGGIRQTVWRAAAPDAVVWHEYSRGALLGAWDFWAPGPLRQRCFNRLW